MRLLSIILLSLLIIPNKLKADSTSYVGINIGTHLSTKGLNNIHPTIGIEEPNYGIMLYRNSFNKVGSFLYFKAESTNNRGPAVISAKFGLISGYNRDQGPGLFISDKLMLSIIPSVKLRYDSYQINFTLAGESLSAGIEFRF